MRIRPRGPSAWRARFCPYSLLRLVDGDGDGCAGAAVGVGGVKRVDGGLRGRDGDAGASDGAGIWGNNHIRNAAYLPGQSDLRAGGNGIRARREGSDLRHRSAGNIVLSVQRRHLNDFEVGSVHLPKSVEVIVIPAVKIGRAHV